MISIRKAAVALALAATTCAGLIAPSFKSEAANTVTIKVTGYQRLDDVKIVTNQLFSENMTPTGTIYASEAIKEVKIGFADRYEHFVSGSYVDYLTTTKTTKVDFSDIWKSKAGKNGLKYPAKWGHSYYKFYCEVRTVSGAKGYFVLDPSVETFYARNASTYAKDLPAGFTASKGAEYAGSVTRYYAGFGPSLSVRVNP